MIRIITDSTSDLSVELIERYQITVIPLHVHLGEREYKDGVDITPDEIYAWSDANKATPKTAAPSLCDVMDIFSLYPEDEILSFSISGNMSTSADVMRLAAGELGREDRIHVVDSRNLSTGIGLLVVEAAEMAKTGASAGEILAEIEALIPRVRASFVVDTLTYLYRGGRCSSAAALAGGVLRLHPQINVENGSMDAGKKFRGSIQKVIQDYVREKREELVRARKQRVFITHSGCPASSVESVRRFLEELDHFDEIIETRAGSVISSHCGPGTLGVLYILEDRESP